MKFNLSYRHDKGYVFDSPLEIDKKVLETINDMIENGHDPVIAPDYFRHADGSIEIVSFSLIRFDPYRIRSKLPE